MDEDLDRRARAAIRHALQFLEDPEGIGDGHKEEAIAACRDVLKSDECSLTATPPSTAHLAIVDDRTISYMGRLMSIELIARFLDPTVLPSKWFRVVRKQSGTVTVETDVRP